MSLKNKLTQVEVNFRPATIPGEVCQACQHFTGTPDFPGVWCFLVENVVEREVPMVCDAFAEATARRMFVEDVIKAGGMNEEPQA